MTIAARRSGPESERAIDCITRNIPEPADRSNTRQLFGTLGSKIASPPDRTGNCSVNSRTSILYGPKRSPYLVRRATSRGAGSSSRGGGGTGGAAIGGGAGGGSVGWVGRPGRVGLAVALTAGLASGFAAGLPAAFPLRDLAFVF